MTLFLSKPSRTEEKMEGTGGSIRTDGGPYIANLWYHDAWGHSRQQRDLLFLHS